MSIRVCLGSCRCEKKTKLRRSFAKKQGLRRTERLNSSDAERQEADRKRSRSSRSWIGSHMGEQGPVRIRQATGCTAKEKQLR